MPLNSEGIGKTFTRDLDPLLVNHQVRCQLPGLSFLRSQGIVDVKQPSPCFLLKNNTKMFFKMTGMSNIEASGNISSSSSSL